MNIEDLDGSLIGWKFKASICCTPELNEAQVQSQLVD